LLQSKQDLLVEELKDIVVGHEQIGAYKSRLQELEKKRKRLEEEIVAIKKYVDLAKTLHRVEADKAKLANLSNAVIIDEKRARPLPVANVTDQSRAISVKRGTRFRKVSPNTFQTLKDTLIEAV